jgi:hypothetical protein
VSELILKPRHRSVTIVIGGALTLVSDAAAWRAVTIVLTARLTPIERACLALAALDATDDEEFFEIVEALISTRMAGSPLPGLLSVEDEARWWARAAGLPEVRAYLSACFARLPSKERKGFLKAASRRAAA